MKSLIWMAAAGVVTFVAALLGPAAFAGGGQSGENREADSRRDLVGVSLVEACRFSHEAPDDPIVFPGQPGASHRHTFVGNRTTDASSTFGSLRSGETTCRRGDDTAAYWVPTLYQEERAVYPQGATIYYRRATLAQVRPFPNGFRMIAGDATATSPQPGRVSWWSCGVASGIPPSDTVPNCPATRGSLLRLHVRYPSCWDGRSLDSADHRSHMAYARAGRCPSSHPVAVAAITQIYRYPTRGGEGFALASSGEFSAHADFFNGWKPGALRRLVEDCLNALVHCGRR